MHLINNNLQRIINLCRLHRVDKLFVFGSILTPRFNENSDVDLVVNFKDIPPEEYADNYICLKDDLVQLFGRDVDLLEDGGIRNKILRANIDRTKLLIYG